MPTVTTTIKYDDGTIKSHSLELPAMSTVELDSMINDASLQAGYTDKITDGKGEQVSNPKDHFRYLFGWTLKVWSSLVKNKRSDRAAELAKNAAASEVDTMEKAVKVV